MTRGILELRAIAKQAICDNLGGAVEQVEGEMLARDFTEEEARKLRIELNYQAARIAEFLKCETFNIPY